MIPTLYIFFRDGRVMMVPQGRVIRFFHGELIYKHGGLIRYAERVERVIQR